MEDVMEALEACNHTELYQLCHLVGLQPQPHFTREALIHKLAGESPEAGPLIITEDAPTIIDSWRHGLYGFVSDHWKELQNQISCPLKSKDPKEVLPVVDACFGCLDMQVMACVVTNPGNEAHIEKYRK